MHAFCVFFFSFYYSSILYNSNNNLIIRIWNKGTKQAHAPDVHNTCTVSIFLNIIHNQPGTRGRSFSDEAEALDR